MGEREPWRRCRLCAGASFAAPLDFIGHLKEKHCTVADSSHRLVCGYCDRETVVPAEEYEKHARRAHVERWSVYDAAQNLPAALNDPGSSHSERSAFFTRTWGDAFVDVPKVPASPHLPEIPPGYLERCARKIIKRQRKRSRLLEAPLVGEPTGPASPETDVEVPPIFFRSDLALSCPRTFETVFPGLGDGSEDGRARCRALQERLGHYLDAVEVRIARQVAHKSDAFFRAMLSHDAIVERMSEATAGVRALRAQMARVDASLSRAPLRAARLARLRANSASAHEKLRLVATVHRTQPTLQLLLSADDYATALDLIDATQSILARELSGVHAFRHLSSQLGEMERLVDKMLDAEFGRFATTDLNRPPDAAAAAASAAASTDEDKLASVATGLIRRRRFEFVDVYKEEAVAAIRAIVKQAIIEEAARRDDGEFDVKGTGEAASRHGADAADLLARLTPRLGDTLERALALRRVALQTADAALADARDADADRGLLETKLQNLVDELCDYCLERCANLVNSSDEGDKSGDDPPTAERMTGLSFVVESFSDRCEEISGKRRPILRTALKNQANRYVQRFHGERKKKLSLLLDNERWKRAEVPAEFQFIVDRVSATGRFPKLDDKGAALDGEKPAAPFLVVENEPYAVVGVVLLAMRFVGEYCLVAEETPGVAPAVGRALVELLRAFNSRCCQLVLGAGALQTAGLKTITTTNLGLASRALQLLLWLLARVRHCELGSFEAVERELERHRAEIEAKLVDIVTGLLAAQLVAWEARPPVPSQQLRNVSRHLVKLHEALAGVLPDAQLGAVYRTVHRNFKDKLREQLARLNIVGDGGPQHGVVTSELTFYLQTLHTLRVLPDDETGHKFVDEIWLK